MQKIPRTRDDPAKTGTTRIKARVLLPLVVTAALGVASFLAAGSLAQSSAQSSGATISLRTTKLGRVLVNSRGHTLYLFKKDKSGKSSCYGTCAKFWPPLLKHGTPTLGKGVKRALLGTTKRRNGTRQLTYNKHPLYTFSLDTRAGQTRGEGRLEFGARWYAVSAKGNAVVKATPSPTTTGTTTTTCVYNCY